MPAMITTEQVWDAIEKEVFAIVGMVTATDQARTVGIVYTTDHGKLYFITGTDTWKARHISGNCHVSVTIPIAKRIPFLPWIRVPSATITFCGTARVFPAADASPAIIKTLFGPLAEDSQMIEESCMVEITPEKDFVTYGVGIPMMKMRDPEQARGRVAVA